MLAVDVSVWSKPAPITVAEWARARRAGYQLAIVGLHHGRTTNLYAHASLANARAAGLLTGGYITITRDSTVPLADIRIGRGAAGTEWSMLRFVSVDVEVDGITVTDVLDGATEVQRLGQRPSIYTRREFWQGHMGDPRGASHYPLWDAHYDGTAVLDYPNAYGGWTADDVIGKQWRKDTRPFGFLCDLSVFDDRWVLEAEPPTPGSGAPSDWGTITRAIFGAVSYAMGRRPTRTIPLDRGADGSDRYLTMIGRQERTN